MRFLLLMFFLTAPAFAWSVAPKPRPITITYGQAPDHMCYLSMREGSSVGNLIHGDETASFDLQQLADHLSELGFRSNKPKPPVLTMPKVEETPAVLKPVPQLEESDDE